MALKASLEYVSSFCEFFFSFQEKDKSQKKNRASSSAPAFCSPRAHMCTDPTRPAPPAHAVRWSPNVASCKGKVLVSRVTCLVSFRFVSEESGRSDGQVGQAHARGSGKRSFACACNCLSAFTSRSPGAPVASPAAAAARDDVHSHALIRPFDR